MVKRRKCQNDDDDTEEPFLKKRKIGCDGRICVNVLEKLNHNDQTFGVVRSIEIIGKIELVNLIDAANNICSFKKNIKIKIIDFSKSNYFYVSFKNIIIFFDALHEKVRDQVEEVIFRKNMIFSDNYETIISLSKYFHNLKKTNVDCIERVSNCEYLEYLELGNGKNGRTYKIFKNFDFRFLFLRNLKSLSCYCATQCDIDIIASSCKRLTLLTIYLLKKKDMEINFSKLLSHHSYITTMKIVGNEFVHCSWPSIYNQKLENLILDIPLFIKKNKIETYLFFTYVNLKNISLRNFFFFNDKECRERLFYKDITKDTKYSVSFLPGNKSIILLH